MGWKCFRFCSLKVVENFPASRNMLFYYVKMRYFLIKCFFPWQHYGECRHFTWDTFYQLRAEFKCICNSDTCCNNCTEKVIWEFARYFHVFVFSTSGVLNFYWTSVLLYAVDREALHIHFATTKLEKYIFLLKNCRC